MTTTYITEPEIRSCINNSLIDNSGRYPFIYDTNTKQITANANYNVNQNNTIKILDILDTFHDLAKDRGAYDANFFVSEIANYLMTGVWFSGDNIDNYKIGLNYPEYTTLKGFSTFESRVAASFEIHNGLQRADITITYDDIIGMFLISQNLEPGSTGTYIHPDFKQTILNSNGSIIIKPKLNENISFDEYKCGLLASGYTNDQVNVFMIKISHFFKWYLHSTDFITGTNGVSPIMSSDNLFSPNVPNEIRFVFDAVGMGGIFDIAGSGGAPYVGAFTVMDSASTSSNLLDPNIGIDYEVMPSDSQNGDGLIVPILSNYFSCEKVFICYLQNPRKKFGEDGIFCFSLIMFKIPEDDSEAEIINACRNIKTAVLNSPEYADAQIKITNYINASPNKVVRYYFGEVEKDMVTNDNAKCGTCGAGVAYLGKVFSEIKKAMDEIQKAPPTPEFKTRIPTIFEGSNPNQYAIVREIFNELKKAGDLRQRIPIADARILKMFFESVGIRLTEQDMLLLYKVLADYKRTGDYQQVYAVLHAVLKTGTNIKNYTHATGDELAALFARMIGLPCVYQVSSIGKNTLYRSTVYMVDIAQREKQEVERKMTVIQNFFNETVIKIQTVMNFLETNYQNIYQLKEQLKELMNTSANQISTADKLLIASAWDTLNKLLTFSNNITENFDKVIDFYTSASSLLSIPVIDTSGQITVGINNKINDVLHQMALASEINFSFLIDYIQFNFPSLSLLNNQTDNHIQPNIFAPLSDDEIKSITFNRPELDLVFTKGKSKNKALNTFRKFTEAPVTPAASSGRSSRSSSSSAEVGKYIDAGTKARITQTFNNFVTALHINDTEKEKYTIYEPKEIREKIEVIYGDYDKTISRDETSSNVAFNLDSVKNQFNQLQQMIPTTSIQRGGYVNYPNYSLIQKGGGFEEEKNKKLIYMKVKQIVITLFEKCNNYLLDVTNDLTINNPNDLMQITIKYDVSKFCKELLSTVNEDIDDLGNEGILTSLKNVASNFTFNDISGNGNETELTVAQMLDNLGLPEVKWLMYMLSVNTVEEPGTNSVKLDMGMSNDLRSEIDLGLGSVPTNIKTICETVNYNQIISILCFTILYKFYNGKNSYLNNTKMIDKYSSEIFAKLNANNAGIPDNGLSNILDEIFLRGLKAGTSLSASSTRQIAPVNSANLPFMLKGIIQELIVLFNIPVTGKQRDTRSVSSSSSSSSSSKANPYAKTYKSSSGVGKLGGGVRKRTRKNKNSKTKTKNRKTYKKMKPCRQNRKTYKRQMQNKKIRRTYKKYK